MTRADGLHARTDGLTSLAVLAAVAGSAFGFPIVDPIIGLLIGVAILFITRDALKTIWLNAWSLYLYHLLHL